MERKGECILLAFVRGESVGLIIRLDWEGGWWLIGGNYGVVIQ